MSLAALCLLAAAPAAAPPEVFDAGALAALYALEPGQTAPPKFGPRPRLLWEPEQMVLQGFFGVSRFDNFTRSGGGYPDVDGPGGADSQMPAIGGGGQWKLGGERIDFGIEGMFSFAGRAHVDAFVAGGGGAAIAVSVDMLVFELYGGPFVSCFIGDRWRVYAAAGPLMEWADYSQDVPSTGSSDSGSGFGTGWYARTGFEYALSDNTLIGLGVRWSEATVDLDNGLGELSVDGFTFALTVTQGF